MRNLIISFMVFLAACNGDGTTVQQVPYSDPALVAQVTNLTKALAAATHVQAQQASELGKLQLIGKVHGISARTEGIGGGNFLPNAVNFGPCADMGVLIGRGGKDSNIPLASALESFQTCTGYSYTVSALDGSIQGPPYAAWDGPNCTGNLLIITDIPGDGFNPQVVNGGVVFTNPLNGQVLMISAGSIPQSMQIQSAMNFGPGGGVCGSPDIETRMVVFTKTNDVSITGVQSTPIPLPISITAP